MMDEIISLLCVLLATCVILVLAYCFTRYVVGRMVPGGGSWRSGHITVLEQVAISRDQKLLLVRVGERIYFLGVTQGSITCLQVVPEEETAKWEEERQQSSSPIMPTMSNFKEVYRKMMEQRKK